MKRDRPPNSPSSWAPRSYWWPTRPRLPAASPPKSWGYQQFDPALNLAGVILNGVGSPAHLQFCKPQIEATTGLPVLGYLPRRTDFEQPERHLGLIPTVEGTVARQWYDSLIAQIEDTIDVDGIVALAGQCAYTRGPAPCLPH